MDRSEKELKVMWRKSLKILRICKLLRGEVNFTSLSHRILMFFVKVSVLQI